MSVKLKQKKGNGNHGNNTHLKVKCVKLQGMYVVEMHLETGE